MVSAAPLSARALLRHRPFQLFFWARAFSRSSYQVAAVAVGWQVYALTHSAFDLGMVGLVQFIPTGVLLFAAGHVADRYNRKRVVQICQLIAGLTAVFLAWGTFAGWLRVSEIFVAVAIFGAATAFESPAIASLLPSVVPEGTLQKATAISTGGLQVALISGPALGGLGYAVAPGVPYLLMAVAWLLAAGLTAVIQLDRPVPPKEPATFAAVFAGVGFVRRNPAILGTISLDLFAVLLGGVTTLLPIYARDILHIGPWGLGLLRATPTVGALLMTSMLARYPIERRVGMRMFQAVIVFGVATIVFAASRSLVVSLIALFVLGAADSVSVVIRVSLVQLATPDKMRGRVNAVNYLFINASNQLGGFESGLTAAWFGVVPAALLGGVGTIMVALLWMKLFPDLRKVERLE